MRRADPLDDFAQDDMVSYRWLMSRPECSICGRHIQEEYAVRINGDWICDSCLKENRRYVEDADD